MVVAYAMLKIVDMIFPGGYIYFMAWDVEYTDEFEAWWVGLDEEEQVETNNASWKQ